MFKAGWYYFTDENGWVGPFLSKSRAEMNRDNRGYGDDPVYKDV